MQLEVGKYYRTQNGLRVHITKVATPNSRSPFSYSFIGTVDGDSVLYHWLRNGRKSIGLDTPLDLVAEWEEPGLFSDLPTCPHGLHYGTEKEVPACDTCYLAVSCFKFSDALACLNTDREDEEARIIAEKEKVLAAEAKEKLGANFFEKNRRHCLAMIAGMSAYRKVLEE